MAKNLDSNLKEKKLPEKLKKDSKNNLEYQKKALAANIETRKAQEELKAWIEEESRLGKVFESILEEAIAVWAIEPHNDKMKSII